MRGPSQAIAPRLLSLAQRMQPPAQPQPPARRRLIRGTSCDSLRFDLPKQKGPRLAAPLSSVGATPSHRGIGTQTTALAGLYGIPLGCVKRLGQHGLRQHDGVRVAGWSQVHATLAQATADRAWRAREDEVPLEQHLLPEGQRAPCLLDKLRRLLVNPRQRCCGSRVLRLLRSPVALEAHAALSTLTHRAPMPAAPVLDLRIDHPRDLINRFTWSRLACV